VDYECLQPELLGIFSGVTGLAYVELVAPLIVAGAGVSMAMPAAQNAVLGSVAATDAGKASGIFNMFRFLGGVFGIAIVVAVFAGTGSVDSPRRSTPVCRGDRRLRGSVALGSRRRHVAAGAGRSGLGAGKGEGLRSLPRGSGL
jgi:hypothetical protein